MKPSKRTQPAYRLKQRFAEYGLDDFEIIELLLSFERSNGNCKELSAELIDRFGSLSRVLDAPLASLTDVSGLNSNSVLWLKLVPQIAQRYSISKNNTDDEYLRITASAQAVKYLQPYFSAAVVEEFRILLLTGIGNVIACRKISVGSINDANSTANEILHAAAECGAAAVVLAHNQLSGLAIPSPTDMHFADSISKTLESIKIKLVDYIIFAGGDYVSMRDAYILR